MVWPYGEFCEIRVDGVFDGSYIVWGSRRTELRFENYDPDFRDKIITYESYGFTDTTRKVTVDALESKRSNVKVRLTCCLWLLWCANITSMYLQDPQNYQSVLPGSPSWYRAAEETFGKRIFGSCIVTTHKRIPCIWFGVFRSQAHLRYVVFPTLPTIGSLRIVNVVAENTVETEPLSGKR